MLRAKCRLIYAYVSRKEEEGTQHHRIEQAFGSFRFADNADGAKASSISPRLTAVGQEEDGVRNSGGGSSFTIAGETVRPKQGRAYDVKA